MPHSRQFTCSLYCLEESRHRQIIGRKHVIHMKALLRLWATGHTALEASHKLGVPVRAVYEAIRDSWLSWATVPDKRVLPSKALPVILEMDINHNMEDVKHGTTED